MPNRDDARLALTMPSGRDMSHQETLDMVRRAEDLGYDSVWAGEAWGRDVFTTLTEVACHTSRIKLGTGIATIYSRTPGMMVQTAGSLDIISHGRLILGLGTSGQIVVTGWHGVPFDKPLQRTREYIDIIRKAFAGERVDYDGEIFHLQRFRPQFQPLRGDVPIFVASLGPKNIALTGELCDGWLPIFLHVDKVGEMKRELAAGAARSGRDVERMEIAPYVLAAVSDDAGRVRDMARAHIAFYVGGMGTFYNNLMRRYGFVAEAERIAKLWAQPGREGRDEAVRAVSDAMVDAMTLVGPGSAVRERLEAFRAAGVTLPILSLPAGSDKRLIEDTLETLAPALA